MSRALWLADVLADTFRGIPGVRVVAEPGWQTRGRAVLYPRGAINHHTGGGTATFASQKRYITSGSSIAPLANWMSSRPMGGVVEVAIIAAGKANHAGRGYLSWTGTDKGNNYAIGGEHQNDGKQAWPGQQVDVIRMGTAAILKEIGVGTDRMADHKTYAPTRKVDRHSTDLATERRIVAQIMAGRTPTPTPTPGDEDEMALKRGDKGNAVGVFQKAILKWAGSRDGTLPGTTTTWDKAREYGADEDFGPTTEGMVKAYQSAADLPMTGVIDGVTSALLTRYVVSGGSGGASTTHTHPVTADPRLNIKGKAGSDVGAAVAAELEVHGILHTGPPR